MKFNRLLHKILNEAEDVDLPSGSQPPPGSKTMTKSDLEGELQRAKSYRASTNKSAGIPEESLEEASKIKKIIGGIISKLQSNPKTEMLGEILNFMKIQNNITVFPDLHLTQPEIKKTFGCPTMGVDHKNLYISAKFTRDELKIFQTQKLVATVLLHEAFHKLNLDVYRDRGKNHNLWNFVCDAHINKLLLRNGFEFSFDDQSKLFGIHLDKDENLTIAGVTINVKDMSTDQMYRAFMNHFKDQNEDPTSDGSGGSGGSPPKTKPIKVGDPVFDPELKEYNVVVKITPDGKCETKTISKAMAIDILKNNKK